MGNLHELGEREISDRDEDEVSSLFSSRRSSLSVLSTSASMSKSPNPSSSLLNSEVLTNSSEQWSSSQRQQHKFMVRGRSLSKSSASGMPSLDNDAEYISKAGAFSSPEPESHAS